MRYSQICILKMETGNKEWVRSILQFSWNLLIFLKSKVLSRSESREGTCTFNFWYNDLAPFHLSWTETMLKQKSLRYSVRNCLKNFLLLSISLRIHKNSKNVLFFCKKTPDLLIFTNLLQFNLNSVPNLYLNTKYEKNFLKNWKYSLLWISDLILAKWKRL